MKSKYFVAVRSKRFSKYLFYWALQVVIANSWYLFKTTSSQCTRGYTHLNFRLELAKNLIGNFTSRKRNPTRDIVVRGGGGPPVVIRPPSTHSLTKLDQKATKTCKLHKQYFNSQKRTLWGCQKCNANMCRNCFFKFHENIS